MLTQSLGRETALPGRRQEHALKSKNREISFQELRVCLAPMAVDTMHRTQDSNDLSWIGPEKPLSYDLASMLPENAMQAKMGGKWLRSAQYQHQ